MSQPLPRYNRIEQQRADQQKLARILKDATPDTSTHKHTRATLPGDKRRLRGIPIAGATTGTSPGTDPLAALLAKQRP